MDEKKIFVALAVLGGAALLLLAVIPQEGVSLAIQGSSKAVHSLQFFVFGTFLFTALYLRETKNIYFKGIIIGLLLAVGSEVAQLAVHSRSFSFADIGANIVGLAAAIIIFYTATRKGFE